MPGSREPTGRPSQRMGGVEGRGGDGFFTERPMRRWPRANAVCMLSVPGGWDRNRWPGRGGPGIGQQAGRAAGAAIEGGAGGKRRDGPAAGEQWAPASSTRSRWSMLMASWRSAREWPGAMSPETWILRARPYSRAARNSGRSARGIGGMVRDTSAKRRGHGDRTSAADRRPPNRPLIGRPRRRGGGEMSEKPRGVDIERGQDAQKLDFRGVIGSAAGL